MREGWREVTLGDVLVRRNDKLGGADEPRILTVTEGYGLVDQLEHWGRRVATSNVSKYKVVDSGDIVYNVYLLWKGAIGQNLLGEQGVTSPVYEVFTPKSGVNPWFLGLVLSSEKMREAFGTISIGTIPRRRRAPWQDFLRLTISLPPFSEQRRIVDLIGSLDDAIAAAEATAFQLERTWWSVAHRLEAEVADLDFVPLGEISEVHGGLTKNKKDSELADAIEVPYLRVANVLRRKIVLDDVATIIASRRRVEASQLQAGDLLMTEGGDRDKLGRGAVWRGELDGCTHQNHVFRVRITTEDFAPEFVSVWSNSFGKKWFETHAAQTTGIASISKSTLTRFPVPRIPFELQLTWASLFDAVHQQEERARVYTERLRELRSKLLTVTLSGEHQIPESYDELMEEVVA